MAWFGIEKVQTHIWICVGAFNAHYLAANQILLRLILIRRVFNSFIAHQAGYTPRKIVDRPRLGEIRRIPPYSSTTTILFEYATT